MRRELPSGEADHEFPPRCSNSRCVPASSAGELSVGSGTPLTESPCGNWAYDPGGRNFASAPHRPVPAFGCPHKNATAGLARNTPQQNPKAIKCTGLERSAPVPTDALGMTWIWSRSRVLTSFASSVPFPSYWIVNFPVEDSMLRSSAWIESRTSMRRFRPSAGTMPSAPAPLPRRNS